MKKLLCILFSFLFFICNAHTAQIVNVEYIHNLISQEWDITVPYNPALKNVKSIANMKYLLTAIDVANEILNGEKTTNYGNGEFATTRIADTIATNQAVETLVKQNKIEYKFSATIDLSYYDDNSVFIFGKPVTEFGFSISAAGTFYIDWGDGTVETIKKDNTEDIEYTHDYGTTDGVYTVQIGGRATDYSDDWPAIAFQANFGHSSSSCQALTDINGSLGAIFGTLSNGKQPRFIITFAYASFLKKIPENLFDGIYGDLVDGMFERTFEYCGALTGPSARINGRYLYEIWPDATTDQVGYMYDYSTGLDDYACIPYAWGGGGGLGEECDSSSNTPSAPEDAVYDFYLTTTSDTSVFEMQISAAGEFYIDWGDGKTEWITKSDTTNMTYGHQYASKGAYNIRLGGQATAYNGNTATAAISFYVKSSQTKIASIDGSLGAIFGTLADGSQPRFYYTFYSASNIKGSIPANLFTGISGKPASYMFFGTFEDCSGLTGAIPDGLFAGISGAPAHSMFSGTFSDCSGLTGAIPEDLFAGISGAPADLMFENTFSDCRGLTGSIPEDLFAGISGAPAYCMFDSTFSYCSGLTGAIPENLFAGISGAPAHSMFDSTFDDCSSLTGAIPDGLFAGISGAPASSMFSNTFEGCRGLTSIPENLFAGISGKPASYMFYRTFSGCSGLTGAIPDGLFAGISGAPASSMFNSTFSGCTSLTSIPENLFGNISGTAQSAMFSRTFYNCGLLTGPSARINGKYLYEIWPSATSTQVGDMYYNATKLDDYSNIPTVWK